MILIENLSKKFATPNGEKKVLDNISISIKDGTLFGIKGDSGIGKSTLVSIIAGLQKADGGTVTVDGTETTSLSDDEICSFRNRNIGFVSQEQSFLENLSVIDNVVLVSLLSRKKRRAERKDIERAEKLLADLGIGNLAKQSPSSLSGGENRRLLIARALMNDPKTIIADEPTDALDRDMADETVGIFKRLSESGKTVVLVTHDEEALKKCDEIFFMQK